MSKKLEVNESIIIMSAVRYMLGRSSYGVGAVCDYLKANKNRLTKSNKEVIVRDIEEHFKEFPSSAYKEDWLEIVELFNPQQL